MQHEKFTNSDKVSNERVPFAPLAQTVEAIREKIKTTLLTLN